MILRRRIPTIAIAAILLAAPATYAPSGEKGAPAPAPAPSPPPGIGDPVVSFTIPDLEGRPVSLADLLEGKVGLVAFWTSWCQPCIEEIPRLRDLARNYRERGLRVVGIGVAEGGDTPARQRSAAARQLINYHLLFDEGRQFQTRYALRGVPHTLLVDGRGTIRWQGPVLPEDVESRIRALLAEAGLDPHQGG